MKKLVIFCFTFMSISVVGAAGGAGKDGIGKDGAGKDGVRVERGEVVGVEEHCAYGIPEAFRARVIAAYNQQQEEAKRAGR